MKDESKHSLSKEERRAIEVHRYYLSEQAGRDVGKEAATQDWLAHHSARWREDLLRGDLETQRQEMLRHKWIESEKAGKDVGDWAIKDWLKRHAAAWRSHREKKPGS